MAGDLARRSTGARRGHGLETTEGVLVTDVFDGPAARAKLQRGDIKEMNGKP